MLEGSLGRSQYNEEELKILNKVILPHCDKNTSPGLSLHDDKGGVWSSCNNTMITLPEPITPLSSDDEESELPTEQQENSNSSQVEDLFEQNRRDIFTSYFQLCPTPTDKYDCTSVMAA